MKETKNWTLGCASGILIILLCFNILAWMAVNDLSRAGFLEVIFFDVGQGEAIFIKSPHNHQVLIDGGPDKTILERIGKEMPFWDRTIDLIILSHPSADHLKGLLKVLERYEVERILWTGIEVDTFIYQEWLRLINQEGAEIFIAQAGQKIKLGPKIFLDVLNPSENLKGQKIKRGRAINNTSIVARLVHNQNSFLLTADIERQVERELKDRKDLGSEVLKIAHHGSRTSSSLEFIETVSPEIAIISVGKGNRHNHPHQEVLERLEKFDIKILRTDLDGDIKISSDGEKLKTRSKYGVSYF